MGNNTEIVTEVLLLQVLLREVLHVTTSTNFSP